MELNLELTGQLRFILDLGVAIAAALIFGVIAVRLGQPAILGYLIAGIVIGPFTPGFVGDAEAITELADLGVILLLFALGIEFTLRELRAGRAGRRYPARCSRSAIILAVGDGARRSRSASTPGPRSSSARACRSRRRSSSSSRCIDRGELDSAPRPRGDRLGDRPGPRHDRVHRRAATAGRRRRGRSARSSPWARRRCSSRSPTSSGPGVMPWILRTVSRQGSSELFLLAVVATALLTAFVSSAVFGLSLALGAFVAGIIVSESDVSLPGRRRGHPVPRPVRGPVLRVGRDARRSRGAARVGAARRAARRRSRSPARALVIAVLGRGFGMPMRSALLLGGAMAQVGEFSFIIAERRVRARADRRRGLQPHPRHGRREHPVDADRDADLRAPGRGGRTADGPADARGGSRPGHATDVAHGGLARAGRRRGPPVDRGARQRAGWAGSSCGRCETGGSAAW